MCKKDIEVSKQREQWGGKIKEVLSRFLVMSSITWRKAEISAERVRPFYRHSKNARASGDILGEIEASRSVLSINSDIDENVIEVQGLKEKLEVSLKNVHGEHEAALLLKVRALHRWYSCLMRIMKHRRRYVGKNNVHLKKSVVEDQAEKAKKKFSKAKRELRTEAKNYFLSEWRRVKKISDSTMLDIGAAALLGVTFISCYLYIYFKSNIVENECSSLGAFASFFCEVEKAVDTVDIFGRFWW